MENSAYAFEQMNERPLIWFQMMLCVITWAMFDGFGCTVTKYASATHRATINTSRVVIIWICSILFLGEAFEPWAVPGLIMIIYGTLTYNEILVIPFVGSDKKEAKHDFEETMTI